MTTKCIFLDIDGPMIPVRAHLLSRGDDLATVFDPCATQMLSEILATSNAKLVISSTHGYRGKDHCINLLSSNGIDPSHLHDDWITPRKMSSSRIHEIRWWLDAHPENTHYVAIDDERLDVSWVPNAVLCDAYEGFSFRNYLECCVYLDCVDPDRKKQYVSLIQALKRREIWRTVRMGEDGAEEMHRIASTWFPTLE